MPRSKTIREDIQPYIDNLIEIYEETNPDLGEISELEKMENISWATDMWWKLFGDLMGWAQSHLTGYAIMKENPEFIDFLANKLNKTIHEGSHELEHFGWTYSPNRPDGECEEQKAMELITHDEYGEQILPEPLTDSAMRTLIAEILMSRSGTTSFWRMPFQHSMFALNHGEVDSLSSPISERKQGRPYQLRSWKIEAVSQVNFRVGKGFKKYIALEEVGEKIGQSPETLRSWEKEILKNDPDGEVDIFVATLAGKHLDLFETGQWRDALDTYEYGSFRSTPLVYLAHMRHEQLKKHDLSEVKRNLRFYREK